MYKRWQINILLLMLCIQTAFAQLTPFEKSNGKETATYQGIIQWYKTLDQKSNKIEELHY